MDKYPDTKKTGINTRIFTIILAFLVIVFVLILMVFNIFIGEYIKTDSLNQLKSAAEIAVAPPDRSKFAEDIQQDGFQRSPPRPDMDRQPRKRIGAEADFFIIDSDYSVEWRYNDIKNQNSAESIGDILNDREIDPGSLQNTFIKADSGDYYVSSKKMADDRSRYLILYVDITTISRFTNTVNIVLIVIMLLAAVISFVVVAFISKSIANPIQKLSAFALKIGKGDFGEETFSFKDREFIELSNAMNLTAKRLDEYNKSQKTFFQNVSHELRTPLMSIKCYAEGIEYGLMESVKSSKVIISETDRLSEMVEDLLYVSRIDNITRNMEKQENDLRETLAECAEHQMSIANRKDIRFVYDFQEDAVLFSYNEKHMYRAFSNLISNALRYAKTEIVLTCKNTNHSILVCVTDDGDGIADKDIPHIFERFYKSNSGKHGIGLSIVKSVVDIHNGSVGVSCDNGTRFTIEFIEA